MPVQVGMVEEELQALPPALLGEHLERILLIWCGVDDVPPVLLGREHGEAVVMLARDGDVLHPGGFGQRHPLGRIELRRIELRGQRLVFGDRHLPIVHDPLAVAQHTVDAPMDE